MGWDKYVSFKQEDVTWDSQILTTIKDSTGGRQELVLLVSVKKNAIKQKFDLLKEAGLRSEVVDTDISCLVNAFCFLFPKKAKSSTIALLDLGDYYSNLVVLDGGILRFSRNIPLGGKDITQGIAQRKRIDPIKAQALKHKFKGKDEEVSSVITMWVKDIINELKVSFEYVKREIGRDVKELYICGGTSLVYRLEESLTEGLGIKVDGWHLNSNLEIVSPYQNIDEYFPKLIVSLGLALNEG